MGATAAGDIIADFVQPPARTLSARAGNVLQVLRAQVAVYPRTPVQVVDVPVEGRLRRIRLKLEGGSPFGAVKGRTSIGLLASLAGRIAEDTRLVESTSGNLGVAVAALCQRLDIPFTAVVDDRLPVVMARAMRSSGADLIVVNHRRADGDRLAARIRTVWNMTAADSRWLSPNQYDNPANPRIHEIWTGPEFLWQVPTAQAIFVGASTGGTLAGCARATRATGRDVKVVGVDVEGSRVFGGAAGPRFLTGIGASRISPHVNREMCDEVEMVSSWAAVVQCRDWKRTTGVGLGGSSGAVLAAALRHLAVHPDLTDIACLCPDLGDNYTNTIYNDRWVAERGSSMIEQEQAG